MLLHTANLPKRCTVVTKKNRFEATSWLVLIFHKLEMRKSKQKGFRETDLLKKDQKYFSNFFDSMMLTSSSAQMSKTNSERSSLSVLLLKKHFYCIGATPASFCYFHSTHNTPNCLDSFSLVAPTYDD